jgi:YHS domain-containing protein
MKKLKNLALLILAISLVSGSLAALADEPKADAPKTNAPKTDAKPKPKAKPYILKTCPVSGDKLGEMGEPYVFEYKGREIKLCCKGCLKDFQKSSAKYVKQIEEAEAKEKAKAKK